MKRNEYEVIGEELYIELNNSNLNPVIDKNDFDKIKDYYFYLDNKGYVRGYKNRKQGTNKKFLHHIIIGNPPEKHVVDHIDRNPLNNKKSNLRIVNRSINAINSNASKKNRLGIRGVYWETANSKYRARVKRNGKAIHLGYYKDLKVAQRVVEDFNKKYLEPYNIEELLKEKL